MRTYARAPVEFVRGEGARLWDAEGKRVPRLLRRALGPQRRPLPPARSSRRSRAGGAARRHARTSSTPSRRCGSPSGSRESSLGGRVFLSTPAPRRTSARSSSSASTPTRAASTRPRSSASRATSTAARSARSRRPRSWPATTCFGPLPRGFVAVPRDDPDALRAAVGERTAAVMIEPIQGEAGVFPIADEVAASPPARPATRPARCWSSTRSRPGWGGPGSLWAYEQLAGAPRRADRAQGARRRPAGRRLRHRRPSSADVLERGDHGSTFAGGAGRAPRRRSRRSRWSTTRRCCARVRELGASACATGSRRSTASTRSAAAA